jgi:DUF4097 and DUF4098 domain-containing protein YvlB
MLCKLLLVLPKPSVLWRSLPVLLLGIPLLITGCCLDFCNAYRGKGVKVDGVRLKHKRIVEIDGTLEKRFEVDGHAGDIEIRGIPGRQAHLRVEVYEYRPGDAKVRLTESGDLVLETESGRPAAVGELSAELPQDLALRVETGMGEIEISTGMGDVDLKDLTDVLWLEASTGMGDLSLSSAEALERVTLSTGMGGIHVKHSAVNRIEVSSGMGSIDLRDCEFGRVTGSTGMGSIHFRDTAYEHSDVSTGMGSVKYH